MHEHPYKPPDHGSSEGTSLSPCRPTVKHCSHSLQRKAWLGRVASFRSDVPCVLLWRSRHSCVRSLFPRSSRLACARRSYRKQFPFETTAYVAAVTQLLDNEQVSMPQLTAGVHFFGGRRPCLLSGGRTVTDIRFAFEALQHDHEAKTFGFATEGPSLTRQEFAEERDINVLTAFGRCLRPALYSSLRSSPSHPTGVSALRVTIAIANARFARKQCGLRKSTAKSRRLIRNKSATSRRVRAGAIGGSTA